MADSRKRPFREFEQGSSSREARPPWPAQKKPRGNFGRDVPFRQSYEERQQQQLEEAWPQGKHYYGPVKADPNKPKVKLTGDIEKDDKLIMKLMYSRGKPAADIDMNPDLEHDDFFQFDKPLKSAKKDKDAKKKEKKKKSMEPEEEEKPKKKKSKSVEPEVEEKPKKKKKSKSVETEEEEKPKKKEKKEKKKTSTPAPAPVVIKRPVIKDTRTETQKALIRLMDQKMKEKDDFGYYGEQDDRDVDHFELEDDEQGNIFGPRQPNELDENASTGSISDTEQPGQGFQIFFGGKPVDSDDDSEEDVSIHSDLTTDEEEDAEIEREFGQELDQQQEDESSEESDAQIDDAEPDMNKSIDYPDDDDDDEDDEPDYDELEQEDDEDGEDGEDDQSEDPEAEELEADDDEGFFLLGGDSDDDDDEKVNELEALIDDDDDGGDVFELPALVPPKEKKKEKKITPKKVVSSFVTLGSGAVQEDKIEEEAPRFNKKRERKEREEAEYGKPVIDLGSRPTNRRERRERERLLRDRGYDDATIAEMMAPFQPPPEITEVLPKRTFSLRGDNSHVGKGSKKDNFTFEPKRVGMKPQGGLFASSQKDSRPPVMASGSNRQPLGAPLAVERDARLAEVGNRKERRARERSASSATGTGTVVEGYIPTVPTSSTKDKDNSNKKKKLTSSKPVPAGKPLKRGPIQPVVESMHPSWIARKEKEEKLKNLRPAGKKITFDD